MTPEERQLLAGLFDRIRGAAGSPRDREAEAFINEAVRQQPYAPYLLTQTVIVQEEGLKAAAAKIEELEAKVRDLEAQPAAGSGSFLGGIGKSLFGGDDRPAARGPSPSAGPWGGQAAPQPQPQPQPQAGPWSQQPQAAAGGSFLKGALGTAAGVAGGMLLANSLSGLFSGHNNSHGIGSGFGSSPASSSDTSGIFPQGSALDDKSGAARFSDASYQNASDDDDDDDDDSSDSSDDGMTDA